MARYAHVSIYKTAMDLTGMAHVVSGEVQTGTVAVSCGNFPEPARPYGRVEDGPPAAAPDLSRATSPA